MGVSLIVSRNIFVLVNVYVLLGVSAYYLLCRGNIGLLLHRAVMEGLERIAFIVQVLVAAQYFALVDVTPDYWWHIIIVLVGSILTCVTPLMDR